MHDLRRALGGGAEGLLPQEMAVERVERADLALERDDEDPSVGDAGRRAHALVERTPPDDLAAVGLERGDGAPRGRDVADALCRDGRELDEPVELESPAQMQVGPQVDARGRLGARGIAAVDRPRPVRTPHADHGEAAGRAQADPVSLGVVAPGRDLGDVARVREQREGGDPVASVVALFSPSVTIASGTGSDESSSSTTIVTCLIALTSSGVVWASGTSAVDGVEITVEATMSWWLTPQPASTNEQASAASASARRLMQWSIVSGPGVAELPSRSVSRGFQALFVACILVASTAMFALAESRKLDRAPIRALVLSSGPQVQGHPGRPSSRRPAGAPATTPASSSGWASPARSRPGSSAPQGPW